MIDFLMTGTDSQIWKQTNKLGRFVIAFVIAGVSYQNTAFASDLVKQCVMKTTISGMQEASCGPKEVRDIAPPTTTTQPITLENTNEISH